MDIAATFTRLVRYEQGSQICYGDLPDSSAGRYRVARLERTPTGGFNQVGQEDVVEKVGTDSHFYWTYLTAIYSYFAHWSGLRLSSASVSTIANMPRRLR